MVVAKKNSWGAKFKRTLTSVLPVADNRCGECVDCGKCCMLPAKCFLLRFEPDGRSYCSINSFKPLNCRKYPRVESEFLTSKTCGFRFK